MGYPIQLSQGWATIAEDIDAEIRRARQKFPDTRMLVTALSEEYGEAIREILNHYHHHEQGQRGESQDTEDPRVMVNKARKELIQCAAMCIRLYMDGDPSHHFPGNQEPVPKRLVGR